MRSAHLSLSDYDLNHDDEGATWAWDITPLDPRIAALHVEALFIPGDDLQDDGLLDTPMSRDEALDHVMAAAEWLAACESGTHEHRQAKTALTRAFEDLDIASTLAEIA